MIELPRKLSALLRIAVADAQKIEKTPGYVLDMSTWFLRDGYDDDEDSRCRVCMAGAVMASRLIPEEPAAEYEPADFNELEGALQAINAMRSGDFRTAATEADIELSPDDASFLDKLTSEVSRAYQGAYRVYAGNFPTEDWSAHLPRPDYLVIADRLEAAGL